MLIVLAAVLVFGAVFGWLWKMEAARRARLDALAAQRNWKVERRSRSGGSSARTILEPASGESWRVTINHGRSTGDGGVRVPPETVYHDPDAAWPSGSAVFGPSIPADMAAMAQMVLGSLDSKMGKMLLDKLLGAGAANLSGLKHIAEPGGAPRQFSMFANVNDIPDGVLGDLDAARQEWSAQYPADNDQLIVIAGPDGVYVRIRKALQDPGQLDGFVAGAGRIAALLKGPA